MIPANLVPYRWAIVAAASAGLVLVGFSAGWVVNGWRVGAGVSALKAEAAEGRASAAEAGLRKLNQGAEAFAQAASQAQQINAGAARRFAAIAKEFQDAKPAPLPDGCRPDDVRLRDRNAAIDVYNAARSGQQPGR